MQTYRVRSAAFPHSVLLDARTPEEATLFGALFYLVHGLVGDLRGRFMPEPWNASAENGEYVPREFFDGIAPQLADLIAAAQIVPARTDDSGSASDRGSLTTIRIMDEQDGA